MADLFWLSDEQWAVVGRFMPTNQPGARRVDDRRVVSGIVHMLRYKERWRAEAVSCRLKDFRRVATRHDELARDYASTAALAAVVASWC